MSTKISWVINPDGRPGEVWNPVVGCTPAGGREGCRNCYARSLHQKRHKAKLAGKHLPAQYEHSFECVQLLLKRMDKPFGWKKRRTVFVNSVSDLFHPKVDTDFIRQVLHVIRSNQRHNFVVLTKRLERVHWLFTAAPVGVIPLSMDVPNLYIGSSVSNQKELNEDAEALMALSERGYNVGVSFEPLLGAIMLREAFPCSDCGGSGGDMESHGSRPCERHCPSCSGEDSDSFGSGIEGGLLNFALVGCESGKERRPCHPNWVGGLLDDLEVMGTPTFVKQLDLDGRVSKKTEEWPKGYVAKELAWGPESYRREG